MKLFGVRNGDHFCAVLWLLWLSCISSLFCMFSCALPVHLFSVHVKRKKERGRLCISGDAEKIAEKLKVERGEKKKASRQVELS